MSREDRKVLLVVVLLGALVVLSLLYNAYGQQYLRSRWDYLRRRYYYERVLKRKLPQHPARFWRRLNN